MKKTSLILTAGLLLQLGTRVYATPSTQVWNPSTDIQAAGSVHLGVDNYFSLFDNDTKPYAFATDVGLTFGVLKNLELGFDFFEPSADPLQFNAKYGLPESGALPAFAVGGCNIGTKKDVTDYNILYGVAAKTFAPAGRISLGYYYGGNENLFLDENGEKSNTGIIATWDKAITDKIWAAVDYASGKSWYGNLSLGASYAFAPNTSVIFGYVIYNNDKINANNQFTTQLDINF
ncbi:MAG: hypothetical protein A2219_05470 [Elusimicrobia bacterium RIFOXYA2_FULL_50_26]|nr:MAG: hypothetical protein A2219_05470 [Elusimicrobia bacterium RIFOXYA2_FULL_50_26]